MKQDPAYLPLLRTEQVVLSFSLFLPSGGDAVKLEGLISISPGRGPALPPLLECLRDTIESTFSWKILSSRVGKYTQVETVTFSRTKQKFNFKSKSYNNLLQKYKRCSK